LSDAMPITVLIMNELLRVMPPIFGNVDTSELEGTTIILLLAMLWLK